MTWISVKERLPGERSQPEEDFYPPGTSPDVIVWETTAKFRVGRYFHVAKRWQVDGCSGPLEVTHWQPLPPPPEDGK